jgi:hypothetical protein
MLFLFYHSGWKGVIVMTVKRKVLWIAGLIIVAAIIIVLCVGYFATGKSSSYDGTLVRLFVPQLFL